MEWKSRWKRKKRENVAKLREASAYQISFLSFPLCSCYWGVDKWCTLTIPARTYLSSAEKKFCFLRQYLSTACSLHTYGSSQVRVPQVRTNRKIAAGDRRSASRYAQVFWLHWVYLPGQLFFAIGLSTEAMPYIFHRYFLFRDWKNLWRVAAGDKHCCLYFQHTLNNCWNLRESFSKEKWNIDTKEWNFGIYRLRNF